MNARLEKETPIFNKQRIDFNPPEKINSLVVSSNQLCMSLGKDIIFRYVQSFVIVFEISSGVGRMKEEYDAEFLPPIINQFIRRFLLKKIPT